MIGIQRADGTSIRIEFMHTYYGPPPQPKGTPKVTLPQGADLGKDSLTRYKTECRLFVTAADSNTAGLAQLAHGNSFCSIHEKMREGQSMKEEGRRRALTRALNDAYNNDDIDKAEVGALLAAYYNRPRRKRTNK